MRYVAQHSGVHQVLILLDLSKGTILLNLSERADSDLQSYFTTTSLLVPLASTTYV